MAAGRPSRTNGADHGDGNSDDGGVDHGDDGSTNAPDSLAQRAHDGSTRAQDSLAQRAQQRKNGAGEPRRGMQPFLRTGPLLPARDDSTRGVAPRTARRNDRPPASYYDDAGLLTYATHCCSEGAAGRPHTAICNRRASASSSPGSDDDSPVAAPRGSAPPARTTGGAAPDAPSVHNASPRAAPLGTSRTHTTQTTV